MYESYIYNKKNLTRGIIKRPSNSVISKYFKMNLKWSDG